MQRILVEEACKNRDKTAEEVIKILDELRPRIRLYAELDTLTYLQKGGRINKSAALVGGLLGIKPIITVNTEGIIVNCKKARGSKKAIIEVASEYRKADVDGRYPVYYLYCKENANCETLKNITGGESCKDFNICCAIGSHIGPNAAGIVYVEKR